MKPLAMLLAAFFLAGCATAPRGYVFSEEFKADVKLVVTVSLDGAFKNRKEVFWMRVRPDDRFVIYPPVSRSQQADGRSADGLRGTGYSVSMLAEAKQDEVVITLAAKWDLEKGSGARETIARIPYMQAIQSGDGPLMYSAVWKKKPNQSSEPTPTAVTTPAAQEIAPAAVVAHL